MHWEEQQCNFKEKKYLVFVPVFVSLLVLHVHAEIESVYFPLAFLRNNVLFFLHPFI